MLDLFASRLLPWIAFFALFVIFVIYLLNRYIRKTREPVSIRCDGGGIGLDRTKLFLDCEFTGLQQKTTLVSIGIVSEDGREFYAELDDYDRSQVSPWIEENVLDNLNFKGDRSVAYAEGERVSYQEPREKIVEALRRWLSQFESVEVWGDVLAYDWILFCELFDPENQDTAERLPRNVFYIPFDISTLMRMKGIDPDISRESFSGFDRDPAGIALLEQEPKESKHNALFDARIIRACYKKLIEK